MRKYFKLKTGQITLISEDTAKSTNLERPKCEEILEYLEKVYNETIVENVPQGVDTSEKTKKKPGCNSCGKNIIKGAIGLAKHVFGIDKATDELVLSRKNTCLNCPTQKYDFGVCSACGCFTAAKITIKGEKCPDGHWNSVE